MSLSDTAEAALLDLLFLNTDWANIGDAAGLQNSATAGSFYIALHTADPGDPGTQTTSECAYTGYARVAVARSGSGFTRSTSTISNAALIQFGACTAGPETARYFSIGTASSGTGSIVLSGALTTELSITASPSIQPQFAIGALTATAG